MCKPRCMCAVLRGPGVSATLYVCCAARARCVSHVVCVLCCEGQVCQPDLTSAGTVC